MAWSTKTSWASKTRIWEMERPLENTTTTMEATKLLTTVNRCSCQTPQNRSLMVLHLPLTSTRRLHRFLDSLHSKQRHHRLASLRPALSVLHQAEVKRPDHRLTTLPRPSPHPSISWAVAKFLLSQSRRSTQHQVRHRMHSRVSVSQSSRLLRQVHLASLRSQSRRTVRAQRLEASTLRRQ